MTRRGTDFQFPSVDEIKEELERENYKRTYSSVLRSTISMLIVVAAIAVLVATIWLPVLQIYGTSMTPTLDEGEIVISVKGADFDKGDLVCFYIGNKLLVKRCIAEAGEWVNIDDYGNVYVNDVLVDEPYVTNKTLGECNLTLPYQVPDEQIFCMGDHRDTSLDSRNTTIGCINEEQIVGKIVFRVWPLNKMGAL